MPSAETRQRQSIVARLRSRRGEVEEAIGTRLTSLDRSERTLGSEYRHGLSAALAAAVDFALSGLDRSGDGQLRQIPMTLLHQARLAAGSGVPLDTLLRSYFVGVALFGDFVLSEARRSDGVGAVHELLRTQTAEFDRVIVAVVDEYRRQTSSGWKSEGDRRMAHVEAVLRGELWATSGLGYELQGHHLAIVIEGTDRLELEQIGRNFGAQQLKVSKDHRQTWVWLRSRQTFEPKIVSEIGHAALEGSAAVAVGEPGVNAAGWRRSHRQAMAVLPVAKREPIRMARYGDVALVATLFKDDLLAGTLSTRLLEPLEADRDGGASARKTLRAYFAANGQISSTASALGITRNTVRSRLRAAELRIGTPVDSCAPELACILRFHELKCAGASEQADCTLEVASADELA